MECVRPAMETGKVGARDAVTIIGETETCRARHERTTEKLKEVTEKLTVTETRIIKETRGEINEREGTTEKVTETQREKQDYGTKDEHTQVELRGDNGVEIGECVMTRCEQQDSLLKEQGETLCPLMQIATRWVRSCRTR